MAIILSDDITTVDWRQLAAVFELAPLGSRDPETLREIFINSSVRCFVFDGKVIVGAGRAITGLANFKVIIQD